MPVERGIDGEAKHVPMRWRFIDAGARLRILYDRQAVFYTERIAQAPQGKRGEVEVAELFPSIESDGIPNDMVMDVGAIHMGTDDKSVSALSKSHGELVPDAVGFGGRDLAGPEALARVVRDHVAFALRPSREGKILRFA